MPSAWDELETKVADTMAAIKIADPEATPFAADLGNVHRFRPEHEHSNNLGAYYCVDVDGERVVRAWCVFVEQAVDFDTIDTSTLLLDCTVTAWYSKGVGGSGVQLLKQHVSVVQGALRALKVDLGGVVSHIVDWSQVSYRSEANPVEKVEGDVIVGEFRFTGRRGMAVI